jgi:hypothetical protein
MSERTSTYRSELMIRGQLFHSIPLETFRTMYGLDSDFGITLFQPKDYRELGSIEGAGTALRNVYATLLAAIPDIPPPTGWMAFTLQLQILLRRQLYAINAQVGLKTSEIDFAVLNFGAICQEYVHRMINNRMRGKPIPYFDEVYENWLNKTIEISSPYVYAYHDELWQVEIVKHAYGRCGLIVQMETATHYLYDTSVLCPAEKFMESLIRAVIERIAAVALRPV